MDINEAIKSYSRKLEYCVYQLIKDGVVIYVGSSRQVSSRIQSHKSGEIEFDSVNIEACKSSNDMFDLEAQSIVAFNPKNNMGLPSSRKYESTKACMTSASSVISNLVEDLPRSFYRSKRAYIETEIYNEFINSIEKFAELKIAELVDAAFKKECK
jgi:hypothetical protein